MASPGNMITVLNAAMNQISCDECVAEMCMIIMIIT